MLFTTCSREPIINHDHVGQPADRGSTVLLDRRPRSGSFFPRLDMLADKPADDDDRKDPETLDTNVWASWSGTL